MALPMEVQLASFLGLKLGGGRFCAMWRFCAFLRWFGRVRRWVCGCRFCGMWFWGLEEEVEGNWDVGFGAGTVDSNVGSGYFLCVPGKDSHHAELLSSDVTEQFTLVKPTEMAPEMPAGLREEAAFSVGDVPGKQVEEIDFSRGILMSDSCTSQLHDLSKLDWMEPRPPGWFCDHIVEFPTNLFLKFFCGEHFVKCLFLEF